MFDKNDNLFSALIGLGLYPMYPNGVTKLGDLFMHVGGYNKVKRIGSIKDALINIENPDTTFKLPKSSLGDLGDIASTRSDKIKRNLGLDFAVKFLQTIGVKAKVKYSSGSQSDLKINFGNPKLLEITPLKLGKVFGKFKLDWSNPALQQGGTYYIASQILQSQSITISSEGSSTPSEFIADVKADIVVTNPELSADSSVISSSNKGITFNGTKPITLAVDLCELYVENNGKISGIATETPPSPDDIVVEAIRSSPDKFVSSRKLLKIKEKNNILKILDIK